MPVTSKRKFMQIVILIIIMVVLTLIAIYVLTRSKSGSESKTRIIKEIVADHPYIVSVTTLSTNKKKRSYACSGVILSIDWVLVGGDCVDTENEWMDLQIRAGSIYWYKYGTIHNVKEYLHSNHGTLTILKMFPRLEFNNYVNKVTLNNGTDDWKVAFTVDWYLDNTLQDTCLIESWKSNDCKNDQKVFGEIRDNLPCRINLHEKPLISKSDVLIGFHICMSKVNRERTKDIFVNLQEGYYAQWVQNIVNNRKKYIVVEITVRSSIICSDSEMLHCKLFDSNTPDEQFSPDQSKNKYTQSNCVTDKRDTQNTKKVSTKTPFFGSNTSSDENLVSSGENKVSQMHPEENFSEKNGKFQQNSKPPYEDNTLSKENSTSPNKETKLISTISTSLTQSPPTVEQSSKVLTTKAPVLFTMVPEPLFSVATLLSTTTEFPAPLTVEPLESIESSTQSIAPFTDTSSTIYSKISSVTFTEGSSTPSSVASSSSTGAWLIFVPDLFSVDSTSSSNDAIISASSDVSQTLSSTEFTSHSIEFSDQINSVVFSLSDTVSESSTFSISASSSPSTDAESSTFSISVSSSPSTDAESSTFSISASSSPSTNAESSTLSISVSSSPSTDAESSTFSSGVFSPQLTDAESSTYSPGMSSPQFTDAESSLFSTAILTPITVENTSPFTVVFLERTETTTEEKIWDNPLYEQGEFYNPVK